MRAVSRADGQGISRLYGVLTIGVFGTYDLTGIDIGVAYEQSFTKYVTVFYRDSAPESGTMCTMMSKSIH